MSCFTILGTPFTIFLDVMHTSVIFRFVYSLLNSSPIEVAAYFLTVVKLLSQFNTELLVQRPLSMKHGQATRASKSVHPGGSIALII